MIYSLLLICLAGTAQVSRPPIIRCPSHLEERYQIQDTAPMVHGKIIWEAALRFYRSRRGPTEAERAQRAHELLGIRVEPRQRAPIYLSGFRDSLTPFDTAWLQEIRRSNLVAGVCSRRFLYQCPESVLATYLTLDDPVLLSPTSVRLRILEVAANPRECGRPGNIVDIQEITLRLDKTTAGDWSVSEMRTEGHATGTCHPGEP
jgi:hypothetical protein